MCLCIHPDDHVCKRCGKTNTKHRQDAWGRFACSDACLSLLDREVGACEYADYIAGREQINFDPIPVQVKDAFGLGIRYKIVMFMYHTEAWAYRWRNWLRWSWIVFMAFTMGLMNIAIWDIGFNNAEVLKTFGVINKVQCPMCGHEYYEGE